MTDRAGGPYPRPQRLAATLLALAFFLQGGAKVLGLERDAFVRWGYPEWSMYAVGVYELLLASAFLSGHVSFDGQPVRFWASIASFPVLLGAIMTHVRVGEFLILPMPLVFLIVAAWLAFASRPQRPRKDLDPVLAPWDDG